MLNAKFRRWFLVVSTTISASAAGELPKAFELGRYVPGDAWMYLHEIRTPQRRVIDAHWQRFFSKLSNRLLADPVKMLCMAKESPDSRQAFGERWDRTRRAVRRIPWETLGGTEFVYAQRIVPIPSHLVMIRNDREQIDKLEASLQALMETVADFWPNLQVVETHRLKSHIWSLGLPRADLAFEMFRRGEILGFSTSRTGTDAVLTLMLGKSPQPPIVETEAFVLATAGVPAPEDGIYFYRWSGLQTEFRRFLNSVFETSEVDEKVKQIKRAFFSAMNELDIAEYTIATRRTHGLREFYSQCTKMRVGAKKRALARAITDRRRFDRIDRFVPVDATSFTCSTMIDVGVCYRALIKFIQTEIPGKGPAAIADWKEMLKEVGFDPERDVFSWLSGETVVVGLPKTNPSQVNKVVFIRVSDPKLARQKLNTALDAAAAWGTNFQVLIERTPQVRAEGFRSVFHPIMFMVQAKPVVGVFEEWMVIGTSAAAVNTCLATARGERPGISSNKRFRKEGLKIDGPVFGASFANLRHTGHETAKMLNMVGAIGAMIPDREETQSPKFALGLLGLIAPVAEELNFFRSTASVSDFKGDRWVTETVINYRPERKRRR